MCAFPHNHVADNLSHLSFSLERGQTLGILGATGSGKSTLVNLLLRFYDPDTGTVFLDGRDIRTIPLEELRPKFGVVFQNEFIMEGDLAGNIRFYRELPQEELDRAARTAQADYIFEKGMGHPVAVRGNNLSGGQKQRLAIAGLWREGRRFWCWMTPPAPWITGPTPPCSQALQPGDGGRVPGDCGPAGE